MFTLKELSQLQTILDYSDFMDDNKMIDIKLNDKQSNSATTQYLKEKVCDLITLKRAWNKGHRINDCNDYCRGDNDV